MKGKWKEDILSLMTLKLSSKYGFGQRKGVTNVQVSIGVRIGKSHQKGLLGRIRIRLEGVRVGPHFLYFDFIGTESIQFGRGAAHRHGGDLFRRRFRHGRPWRQVEGNRCETWGPGFLSGDGRTASNPY